MKMKMNKQIRKRKGLEAFYAKIIGNIDKVFVPNQGDEYLIDICSIPKNDKRNFRTLITAGMSHWAQCVPEQSKEIYLTEIFMYMNEATPRHIRIMDALSKFPLENETFLTEGTLLLIDIKTEPGKIEKVPVLFMSPYFDSRNLLRIKNTKTNEKIKILWALILKEDEFLFAQKHGVGMLFSILWECPLEFFIDENRKSMLELVKIRAMKGVISLELEHGIYCGVKAKLREHYSRHMGEIDFIKASPPEDAPQVDIYAIKPNQEHPFFTLATNGMSNEWQNLTEYPEYRSVDRMEAFMHVESPDDWRVQLMHELAMHPFRKNTKLGLLDIFFSETINPKTGKPCALFMMPPCNGSFISILFTAYHGMPIQFLWALPITERELDYVKEYGADALKKIFMEMQPESLLDENRESVV
jgi:hypothetical protein